MNHIKTLLWTLTLSTIIIWCVYDINHLMAGFFEFRASTRLLSGILALIAMSVCIILAARFAIVESIMQGLDKSYRLHKWLGITALISGSIHFYLPDLLKAIAKNMGIPRPEEIEPMPTSALQEWIFSMAHTAENIGEWSFYAMAALIIIALVSIIKYRWFIQFHYFIIAAYLALVFHAIILMPFEHWLSLSGIILAIFMSMGTFAAVWILLGLHRKIRQHRGIITQVRHYPSMNAVALNIKLPTWKGHQAGQFAFITLDAIRDKAHPFTISSAYQTGADSIEIMIKDLGDFTHTLHHTSLINTTVWVEGAYGRFTFNDKKHTQLWIASGIGITPFFAALQQLAVQNKQKRIHLFYCYRHIDPAFEHQLIQLAQQAGVTVHLWSSNHSPRLNAEALAPYIEHYTDTSVWFCGQNSFAQELRKNLLQQGLPASAFHQEMFQFR